MDEMEVKSIVQKYRSKSSFVLAAIYFCIFLIEHYYLSSDMSSLNADSIYHAPYSLHPFMFFGIMVPFLFFWYYIEKVLIEIFKTKKD